VEVDVFALNAISVISLIESESQEKNEVLM